MNGKDGFQKGGRETGLGRRGPSLPEPSGRDPTRLRFAASSPSSERAGSEVGADGGQRRRRPREGLTRFYEGRGHFSQKGGEEGRIGSQRRPPSPGALPLSAPSPCLGESLTSVGHHQLREHALPREDKRKVGGGPPSRTRTPLESGVPGICASLEPTLPSLPAAKERARCPSPTVCKDRTPRTQEGKEERVPPGGLALAGLERERGYPKGPGENLGSPRVTKRKGEPPQWFEIKCPSGSAMEKVLPSGVPG